MKKSLLGVTDALLILLRLLTLLSALWLPAEAYLYYSYSKLSPTLDYMAADTLADRIVPWVGVPLVFVAVGAVILYFVWLYRAVSNLRLVEPAIVKTSPGWAIGWYFVPLASLFMPHRVMKQVWWASHQAEAGQGLVTVWWLTVVAWIFAGNSLNGGWPATVGEYVGDYPAQLLATLLSIAVSAMTLILVKRISRAYRCNVSEWQVSAPMPPTGWYDDPAGSGKRRFWTGDAWGRLDDEDASEVGVTSSV